MARLVMYAVMFFLSQRRSSGPDPITLAVQNVTEKIHSTVAAMLAGFFLVFMAMAGFILTLFVLAQQYDHDGFLSWSATLAVGLGLFLIPLLLLAITGLRMKSLYKPAPPPPQPRASGLPKALEEFAAQWLREQMEERKQRRQRQASSKGVDGSESPT